MGGFSNGAQCLDGEGYKLVLGQKLGIKVGFNSFSALVAAAPWFLAVAVT